MESVYTTPECALGIIDQFIDHSQALSRLVHMDISLDDNQWSVLYGPNIQEGICGFGDTPNDAIHDFDQQAIANRSKAIQLIEKYGDGARGFVGPMAAGSA